MREIKFRAWDGKEMYCPILDNNVFYASGQDFLNDVETKDPVMQYTGLKDKNGIEIYEDDVLEDSEDIVKVGFEEGQFKSFYRSMSGKWLPYGVLAKYLVDHEGVVKGNIHEHHHLLPKEEEQV